MSVLVLTAHGSADPRSAAVAHALAGRLRRLRPWLDVRTAFLDHCAPTLSDELAGLAAEGAPAVVVPMLLADAYHARVDIPSAITLSGAHVRQADVLGEDPALIALLARRLTESAVAPDDSSLGVIVTAVGSSNDAANARTATVAHALGAGASWVGTEVAFATGPHPTLEQAAARLRDRGARRLVVAPWFLAPGRITDRVATSAARLDIPVCEPLGAHNLVAAALLDRYDEAVLGAAVAA